jgi:primase-polymerase (primpol)-like protein
MTYRDARDAVEANYVAADGLGFVLNNDGIVCVDLDDCVVDGEPNEFAREFVSALGSTYCEFSPSGRGLHVWGYASLDKGKVLAGENLKVEVYPAGRFITMTGKVYRDGGLSSLNLSDALQLVA